VAKGIGGAFKKLKKKITLRGTVGLLGKVGATLPVVGGVVSSVADTIAAGGRQGRAAQQLAQERVQAISAGSAEPVQHVGGGAGAWVSEHKKWLIWGAIALVAVFLLPKLIKKVA